MSFGILTQFIMQTSLIVVVALLFIPIIYNLAYTTNLFSGTTAETKEHRDALWKWTIVIFIGAMAGNVVWLLRALQSQQAGQVEV